MFLASSEFSAVVRRPYFSVEFHRKKSNRVVREDPADLPIHRPEEC